ncbi:tRNA (guanine-N1)-methyltransferase [Carboxylicivirga sp. N1Y90]|uniref:tRNA (guanine-N1)-methyltransferase n=1 Tax=Carboxylicivirga fragile TaxID=3417571 RepID=UPI003D339AA7|nr:tRNA (guanine-N1)-methyltransferase [Marinilabiliaceae bacterium N1Y90]
MRKIGRYGILLLFLANTLVMFAQTPQDVAVFDSTNVKGQFDYVIKKSNTFEQFKVVKTWYLNKLRKSASDSIVNLKGSINKHQVEIEQLNLNEAELNSQITVLKTNLDTVTKSKDSIALFGNELSKSLYNTIMWSLVLGLTALAVILFLLFKRSNSITNETKHRLSELEEEFENHRKSALKREQKLAREHMDFKMKNKL